MTWCLEAAGDALRDLLGRVEPVERNAERLEHVLGDATAFALPRIALTERAPLADLRLRAGHGFGRPGRRFDASQDAGNARPNHVRRRVRVIDERG